MDAQTEASVIGDPAVILPPKSQDRPRKPKKPQIKFQWADDTRERLRALAKKSGRSLNEASEMLMRWALDKAEHEWEAVPAATLPRRKNKDSQ